MIHSLHRTFRFNNWLFWCDRCGQYQTFPYSKDEGFLVDVCRSIRHGWKLCSSEKILSHNFKELHIIGESSHEIVDNFGAIKKLYQMVCSDCGFYTTKDVFYITHDLSYDEEKEIEGIEPIVFSGPDVVSCSLYRMRRVLT